MDRRALLAYIERALRRPDAKRPKAARLLSAMCRVLVDETVLKDGRWIIEQEWRSKTDRIRPGTSHRTKSASPQAFHKSVQRLTGLLERRFDEKETSNEFPKLSVLEQPSVGPDDEPTHEYRLKIEPEILLTSKAKKEQFTLVEEEPNEVVENSARQNLSSGSFEKFARRIRSPKIEKNLLAIDGLIVLWMSDDPKGLEATALTLNEVGSTGLHPRTGLPEKFTEFIIKYYDEFENTVGENRPKVWVRDYRTPLSDRPFLTLTTGKTNYVTSMCLQRAFDSRDGIRQKYENNIYDILNDLPNIVVIHSIILTKDQHLILAQRKRKQVDFAGGDWSVSFEEQWDPDLDNAPYDTIIRGLREEFNVDANHGVPVSVDNIQLLAFGREWGDFWDIAMIYLVRLPVNAETVLKCWTSIPPPQDWNENIAVAAVPTSDDAGREFLLSLLNRETKVSSSDLMRVCGPDRIKGTPSPDDPPHRSTGRARILFALWVAGKIE